ncbi:hypothetical protein HDV05_005984 [Chytridiales sp. JEL 0842]|nr:hypothetical protein HDV05_005984 [Chytridiales sp. JEL 0842]
MNTQQQQQQQPSSSGGSGGPTAATGSSSSGNAGGNSNTSYGATGQAPDLSKEARIAHRKQRVEMNRLAKLKPEKTDDTATRRKPKVEPEQKDTGKAKAQISTSSKRIDSIKLSSTELVTNVKVGAVARESVRRWEESKKVEVWERKRAEEAIKSEDLNAQIESQWEKILKVEGPYELNEILLKQKQECDNLMSNKNRLINEYVLELKGKDDEYVKELKRQSEEVDVLLERMEAQYRTLQTTLREELEQIEKSFVEERTEMIDNNIRDIEAIFSQRRENERKYMEERADRIEDHIKQLESLRVRDAEEYNLVKIKLETDVQVLEQQLQQMRATYQLNTEKLEYNFQVLKKREEENATILGTQKRKITRLTDHLNMLKAKMGKQEKTFHQEYLSLNDDYKRITEQFKELQKKFRHFQMADSKKYREVWKMNEEMTRELMRKVVQADRIIHEQQLGMKWTPPAEDLFRSIDPTTLSHTDTHSPTTADNSDAVVGTISVQGAGTTHINSDPSSNTFESLAAKFKDHRGYSKTMKRMLELLCNEAGFLVEDKLQKLLAPLHRDEQSLMKLDSIFKALGVETVEDIEKLTSFFVAREHAGGAGGEPATTQEGGEGVVEEQTNLIHPNDVVKAIRRFVEHHRSEKNSGHGQKHASDFSAGFDDQLADDADLDRLDGEDTEENTEKAEQAAKSASDRQKEYWERMANVIDDKSYRIWTAVYVAMQKYNSLLTERWQLTEDIKSVSVQNDELKALLRQYMAAKVNDELQVPPTQIMLAQAGMLDSNYSKEPYRPNGGANRTLAQ